ncbi:MAG: hypothetical protein ACRDOH_00850 [Streptosporangiaceae bacterium]
MGDEARLDVGFAVARERLARLSESGVLFGTSRDAYGHGTTGLARVGLAGVSKLVRVQVRELSWTDRSAGLALRWEATGVGGGLFPVLDADLKLAPAGDQGTVLTMAGAYRPPLGSLGEALDRAVLRRVAAATIRSFVARVAAQITGQPGPDGTGSAPPPRPSPKVKA